MTRERALKVVLVLAGLLFSAAIYPLTTSLWKMNESDYGDDMMLSLYFALGIFLLMAVRNPSANRSLVELRSRSGYGRAGSPYCERTRGSAKRCGCARYYRCSPDRAGPGDAVRRARIRGRWVGSHSGKNAGPEIFWLKTSCSSALRQLSSAWRRNLRIARSPDGKRSRVAEYAIQH
jgi:hypothetical protein